MKFFTKFITYFLLVALVFSIFSGCRTKGPPEVKKNYAGVELTYYKMFDDEEIMQPLINEYIAQHPGLKIHYRMFTDFEEYQKVILNEMAEGEGPDIFSMQNTWFTSNYKKVNPLPREFGKPVDFAATFVDTAYKDLVRTDENGIEQVYAVPMTVDTLALYYNKEQFEDRIPTRGRPSVTWEGIKEDVIQLNKEDNSFERFEVSGIAMGRTDNISRGVDILYLLLLQYGAKFYNENISEAIFASQQKGVSNYPGLDALEFFTSFADENNKHYSWNEFMVEEDSQEKELEAFARGKVSMMLNFAFAYSDVLNQISVLKNQGVATIDPSAIRIASAPQLFDPSVSKEKRVTYANYFAETVSRNSEYPDIAWDFLLHLTKKENLEHYFEKTHKPTSRRDMIQDQTRDPIYGVFASQIGFAESFPIVDYYFYKDIFNKLVISANENGSLRGDLVEAQEKVTKILPAEGLLIPKAEITEEEMVDKVEQ